MFYLKQYTYVANAQKTWDALLKINNFMTTS